MKIREEATFGYAMPISAITKKSARKGRQIDGMDDGWIDMELDEDDEPPTDPKKK